MALAVLLFCAIFTPAPASAQLSGNSLDADSATLENSGGKWTSWYAATVARSTEQARTGTGSLKVTPSGANWGAETNNWPGFPAGPGVKRITYSARSSAALTAGLNVQWKGSAGNTIATNRLWTPSLNAAWQTVTLDAVAPTGTVSVRIELTGDNAPAGSSVYFDDFYVGDNASSTTTTTTASPTTTTTAPPPPPPPPAGAYPTTPPAQVCGNAAILDGPATAPTGAVVVPAGNNSGFWSYPNNYPAGTTFWFAPGTHTLSATSEYDQIQPKTGDTYVGGPGAILDGQLINRYAFTGGATGVTIKHLTVKNFMTPSNEGAVNSGVATGWTIANNTVENNGGAGVLTGDNVVIRDNCLTRNGAYGIQGYKPAPARGYGPSAINNVIVTRNEISYHPRDTHLEWNADGSSAGCGCTGGTKFWDTKGAAVTNNYVHHNTSPALWADTNNVDFLIEGNYLSDNGGEAIWYEISYNATIRNNTLLRNTWEKGARRAGGSFPDGPIYIAESGGDARVSPNRTTLEITGNYLEDNWGGVAVWEHAERFCASGANTSAGYCTKVNPDVNHNICGNMLTIQNEPWYSDCRWNTQNVLVSGNTFKLNLANVPAACAGSGNCGTVALFSNYGTNYPGGTPYTAYKVADRVTYAANNRFASNTYVGDWKWSAHNSGNKLTFAQWQAAPYNQDTGSTYKSGSTPTTTTSSTTTTIPPSTTTTTTSSTTTTIPPSTTTTIQPSTTTSSTSSTIPTSTYRLVYSMSPNRANPVPLTGAMVAGSIYAFTAPELGDVVKVEFWLDNPAMSGPPRLTEKVAPFDFAGGTKWTAKAWNSASVGNGSHTITARIYLGNGTTTTAHATFGVVN